MSGKQPERGRLEGGHFLEGQETVSNPWRYHIKCTQQKLETSLEQRQLEESVVEESMTGQVYMFI